MNQRQSSSQSASGGDFSTGSSSSPRGENRKLSDFTEPEDHNDAADDVELVTDDEAFMRGGMSSF